jgi:hypothetical protein
MAENEDKEIQTEEEIQAEEEFKMLTMIEVEDYMADIYDNTENNNSTICDVIAIYLKGQKILYTEAKTTCEMRLTFLMLPAIFLTVSCSVATLLLKDYQYGTLITSSVNGCIAFILAVVNYLKLDARAEAHKMSAYKFDKLQSEMEFNSAKMLFIKDASKELGRIILNVENNVREIKETNQFILPEKIRVNFPYLYGTNVFSEVKKKEHSEKLLLHTLMINMNDTTTLKKRVLALEHQRNAGTTTTIDGKNVNDEIATLNDKIKSNRENKDDLHSQYLEMKTELLNMDRDFNHEIKRYMNRNRFNLLTCECLKV